MREDPRVLRHKIVVFLTARYWVFIISAGERVQLLSIGSGDCDTSCCHF